MHVEEYTCQLEPEYIMFIVLTLTYIKDIEKINFTHAYHAALGSSSGLHIGGFCFFRPL